MNAGLVAIVLVLVLATAFGIWRAKSDGRFKARSESKNSFQLSPEQLGEPLGERATLLEFSSAFCAPCRATRQVLDRVARDVEGVALVEVDAEKHLDLTRALGVMRTPTVFVLDADGYVRHRAAGQPKYADVAATLGTVIG